MMQLFPLAMFAACAPNLPINVSTDGFEGMEVSGEGLWLRETLNFVQSGSTEVMNLFVLMSEPHGDCAAFQLASNDEEETLGALLEAIETAPDPREACEAEIAYYAAYAELFSIWADPGLRLEFQLWDTVVDEGNIGVFPDAGVPYTELDGPDADVVEWAGSGTVQTDNWFAAAAESLDCELAASGGDAWERVPDQEEMTLRYSDGVGTLTFDPHEEVVGARLNTTFTSDTGGTGHVEGDVVFERCELTRVIDPPLVID